MAAVFNTDCEPGKLWIVSTGPGDSKYLTLQAVETIRKADLVLARPQEAAKVSRFLEGKTVKGPEQWSRIWRENGSPWIRDLHDLPLEERRRIADKKTRERDDYARELKKMLALGKQIVILDEGDPTIFSTFFFWLLEAFPSDQVEIVPGVGAMTAAFAALKRCSTGADSRYVLQTGPDLFLRQSTSGKPEHGPAGDLARHAGTLVFYMALEKIAPLAENLKTHLPGNVPVAVVYHAGVSDKEKIIQGTLDTISTLTAEEDEKWIGLVIVGRCLKGSALPPAARF
jgi:precorrin-4 methylase